MTAKLYKAGDLVRTKNEDELCESGWKYDPRCEAWHFGDMAIRLRYVNTRLTIAKIKDNADYYTIYIRAIKQKNSKPNAVFIDEEIIITDEMIAEKEGAYECQQELQLGISAGNDEMVELIINKRIEKTKETLIEKAKQYARNGRLGNFYDIASFNETTAEKAAMILLSKHFVALKDYVNNPESVPLEQWEEKIGDIICYLHLLEAIIKTKEGK